MNLQTRHAGYAADFNDMAPSGQPAILFDIQRFSLHDGPGIRTTLFFKGCPLSCAWCQNPESQKSRPELIFYAETCLACDDCREVCPENAICEDTPLRFLPERCTACGACVAACTTNSLRRVGKPWHATDLLHEVIKDIDFFQDSGGGVTLSGGEPFIQTGFLQNWLPMIKEQRIHVTIETSGMVPWSRIESLLPWLDLVYYDLKHMTDAVHRRHTGCGNKTILENFGRLSKRDVRLQARMPLIPGINDTSENIRNTAQFLQANGHTTIHILPYHNLGEAKLTRIATRLRPMNLTAPDPDQMQEVKKWFHKEGIHAVLYD